MVALTTQHNYMYLVGKEYEDWYGAPLGAPGSLVAAIKESGLSSVPADPSWWQTARTHHTGAQRAAPMW